MVGKSISFDDKNIVSQVFPSSFFILLLFVFLYISYLVKIISVLICVYQVFSPTCYVLYAVYFEISLVFQVRKLLFHEQTLEDH